MANEEPKTPEWRIKELRDECAEHTISGAADLPAARARFIVEICDDRTVLLAACDVASNVGCGGYNNHQWADGHALLTGETCCIACGITPRIAEQLVGVFQAAQKARGDA